MRRLRLSVFGFVIGMKLGPAVEFLLVQPLLVLRVGVEVVPTGECGEPASVIRSNSMAPRATATAAQDIEGKAAVVKGAGGVRRAVRWREMEGTAKDQEG